LSGMIFVKLVLEEDLVELLQLHHATLRLTLY
jgi:hypothetical protein